MGPTSAKAASVLGLIIHSLPGNRVTGIDARGEASIELIARYLDEVREVAARIDRPAVERLIDLRVFRQICG